MLSLWWTELRGRPGRQVVALTGLTLTSALLFVAFGLMRVQAYNFMHPVRTWDFNVIVHETVTAGQLGQLAEADPGIRGLRYMTSPGPVSLALMPDREPVRARSVLLGFILRRIDDLKHFPDVVFRSAGPASDRNAPAVITRELSMSSGMRIGDLVEVQWTGPDGSPSPPVRAEVVGLDRCSNHSFMYVQATPELDRWLAGVCPAGKGQLWATMVAVSADDPSRTAAFIRERIASWREGDSQSGEPSVLTRSEYLAQAQQLVQWQAEREGPVERRLQRLSQLVFALVFTAVFLAIWMPRGWSLAAAGLAVGVGRPAVILFVVLETLVAGCLATLLGAGFGCWFIARMVSVYVAAPAFWAVCGRVAQVTAAASFGGGIVLAGLITGGIWARLLPWRRRAGTSPGTGGAGPDMRP